jgi:hypothetical protein
MITWCIGLTGSAVAIMFSTGASKVRFGGTPKPALETSTLPETKKA